MENGHEKKTRRCSEEANLARREEILETATALFAEQGFSDAVTQALAERLGVGKGTIYRHFPSKRALFLAATDRVMRKLQESVSAKVAGIEDGLERIERGIATFLQFFADHPSFVELLIQERAYFKDRKRPTYFEHREVNIQRWRQLYRELMAAGRIREMPVERITTVVSNVLYGIMVTNFFNGQPAPADVQAREILDIIFLGILTRVGARRRCRMTSGGTAADDRRDGQRGSRFRETSSSEARTVHEATMVDGPVGAVAGGDGGTGCQQAQSGPARTTPIAVYDLPITRTVTDYEEFPGETDSPYSVQVRARVSGYMTERLLQGRHDGQEGRQALRDRPPDVQGRPRPGRGDRRAVRGPRRAAQEGIPPRQEPARPRVDQPGGVRPLRGRLQGGRGQPQGRQGQPRPGPAQPGVDRGHAPRSTGCSAAGWSTPAT